MNDQELRELCEAMASDDSVAAIEAATKVIYSAADTELRSEYLNHLIAYQKAGDSMAMNAALENLVRHVKSQYALIYLQGFVMGGSFQENRFKEALNGALAEQERSDKIRAKLAEAEEKQSSGTVVVHLGTNDSHEQAETQSEEEE